MDKYIDTSTIGQIKKAIRIMESEGMNDNSEVAYEFVLGYCFPNAYKKIKERIEESYKKGVAAGIEYCASRLEDEIIKPN